MKTWRTFSFTINGLPVEARYTEENIWEIWNPLLLRLEEMQRKKGDRLVVFLAAPPATGKSTLATFLSAHRVCRHDAGRSSLASPGVTHSCLCRGENRDVCAGNSPITVERSGKVTRADGRGISCFYKGVRCACTRAVFYAVETRAPSDRRDSKFQALGLDGFHYHQDYILSHTVTLEDGRVLPMKQVKGSPETYDVPHFAEKLRALRQGDPLWPVYDRRLHDVVEEQTPVTAPIVLIEGNWLLLQEGGWKELSQMADYTIFIRAEEALLRERLIGRKMQGGLSREEAETFYQTGDGVNVRRVLAASGPADLTLRMEADGSFTVV